MTKTAEKPYLWAAHTYITYAREYYPLLGFPLSVLVKGGGNFFSASYLGKIDVESGRNAVKFRKWRPSENSSAQESCKPQELPQE